MGTKLASNAFPASPLNQPVGSSSSATQMNRGMSRVLPTTNAPAIPRQNRIAVQTNAEPTIATNSFNIPVVTNALPLPNVPDVQTNLASTNVPTLPEAPADFVPRPVQNVLEAQLFLARRGLSPGPIDGVMGGQTRGALQSFQGESRLPITGILDDVTRQAMQLQEPVFAQVIVTAGDLAGLQPVPDTWLAKSQLARLEYSTPLEWLAEKGWAYQSLVARLNPSIDWSAVTPGTAVKIPNVSRPQFTGKAAQVRIFLSQRILEAFDQENRLMAHFPCSIARRVDKRPVGELHVSVLAPDPDYTFDPEIFPESEEGRQLGRKLRIPPGPNNPVGVAWVGLDRSGYGIHGTPDPEKVGRTESHGCFRLANWNARLLLDLAWKGMPVYVEP
ncbi:L,D-transpeptidase family protein [bacterium]|nr:L,D-transpeptidase family protein [bacterium]